MAFETNPPYKVTIETDLPVLQPDGTRLYVDLYRPSGGGPYPALLINQPYGKFAAQSHCYAPPAWYARQGYIVVAQDTRGRFSSEGDFYPFRTDAQDIGATIQWVRALPGCNGRVATYGFSYGGMNQLLAATRQPEGLVTAVPAFTSHDLYEDWHYVGGAFALGFAATWALSLAQEGARKKGDLDLMLRLKDAGTEFPQRFWRAPLGELFPSGEFRKVAPYYYDWLEHPTRDAYWDALCAPEQYRNIQVPMLHIGGWYDTFLEGTLKNFIELKSMGVDARARQTQRLIVGPWYHMPWAMQVGAVDFGPEAANLMDEYQLEWFNCWLKDLPCIWDGHPPVRIFVMGENRWRDEADWPLSRAKEMRLYLHSGGRANSNSGNGWLSQDSPPDELPDLFVYDPTNPVPSYGGRSCCFASQSPMGPEDQRPAEMRNDVLVYTSDFLEHDLEVTGDVKAALWASSSARDTDFTVKLVDVFPDGRAVNLCDGILRARFRDPNRPPTLIEPNAAYCYEIQVGATSNLFKKGHRIRVDISSSNFPLYDRNPNTGQWPKDAGPADFTPALQTLFHDSEHPSFVSLPVVER